MHKPPNPQAAAGTPFYMSPELCQNKVRVCSKCSRLLE